METSWKDMRTHGIWVPEETSISITQHAVERYRSRARCLTPTVSIENEIRQQVHFGLENGLLFRADRFTFIAALKQAGKHRVCAVVRTGGSAGAPATLTVCTVLTIEMAERTFPHLLGLMDATREHLRSGATA